MLPSLSKDVVKAAGEQPDEETHRLRSGSALSTGAAVLWGGGGRPAWYENVLPPPEALRTPHYWGFLETSSHRQDLLLTPFPAPLWRSGKNGAENSKLLIIARSPGDRPPSRSCLGFHWSHLIRIRHSYHLGHSKGPESSLLGDRDRDKSLYFLLPLIDQFLCSPFFLIFQSFLGSYSFFQKYIV